MIVYGHRENAFSPLLPDDILVEVMFDLRWFLEF